MCESYDPRLAKRCRQEEAEEVRGKESANFCDYFRPRPNAFDQTLAAAEQKARNHLDDLFGSTKK